MTKANFFGIYPKNSGIVATSPIIGCGEDVTIRELSELVAAVVGFEGEVLWDTTKPDGTPRKLLDVSRLKALGWAPKIGLGAGIESTYEWFSLGHDRG